MQNESRQGTLPVIALRAALAFAATKDIRYYMNGVHIRFRDGLAVIEATDGHIGVAVGVSSENNFGEGFSITIPSDTIKSLKKSNSKAESCTLKEKENGSFLLEQGDTGLLFQPVGGTFPEIRRIIRGESELVSDNWFDPDLLKRVMGSFKLLGKMPSRDYICGTGCMRLSSIGESGQAVALIMPMKSESVPLKELLEPDSMYV